MMNKKTIYIVIAVLGIAAVAYYFWNKKKAAAAAEENNNSSSTVTGSAAVATAQAAQSTSIMPAIIQDYAKPIKLNTSSFKPSTTAVSNQGLKVS